MRKKRFLLVLLLCFILVPGMALGRQDGDKTDDNDLKYNVSVNVKMLPVFALDKNGEPVLDLAREDMELYVNGQPVDIAFFKRFDMESSTFTKKEVVREENVRVMFLILDTMFNSQGGFRRTKQLAVDLVKKGRPTDRYVVFENSAFSGLSFVAGPGQTRKEVIKRIKKIRRPMGRWASQMFQERELTNNIDFSLVTDTRLETEHWRALRQLTLASEKLRYKYLVKHFSRTMSNFKYILKTINKPKIVFLISEGMASGAFKFDLAGEPETLNVDELSQQRTGPEAQYGQYQNVLVKPEQLVSDDKSIHSPFLFKYLGEVARSVNFGGSVIYTINPKRMNDTNDLGISGEVSLRFLASESGGRYFEGSDSEEILKRIDKSTSAFYQLAFYNDPKAGDQLEIRVKSRRDGIRIRTTQHAEGSKNYLQMDHVLKRMFVLNVVRGGSWSRSVGKVMRVGFQKNPLVKPGKKPAYNLVVHLPNEMKNKRLDMYLIHLDMETQQVDIDKISKDAKDWLNMKVTPRKNKKQFFVIIEPLLTYCIYNAVG